MLHKKQIILFALVWGLLCPFVFLFLILSDLFHLRLAAPRCMIGLGYIRMTVWKKIVPKEVVAAHILHKELESLIRAKKKAVKHRERQQLYKSF